MISGQKLAHDFHCLPDPFTVRAGSIHGENFHSFLDLVLTGWQQLTLGGAAPAFLSVDLHDAKPAHRYWPGRTACCLFMGPT